LAFPVQVHPEEADRAAILKVVFRFPVFPAFYLNRKLIQ